MKVGIYARVSTKGKGQEVENQLRQLREFALQGWTIYREFIDHDPIVARRFGKELGLSCAVLISGCTSQKSLKATGMASKADRYQPETGL